MKRIAITLASAAALALTTTACGSSDSTAAPAVQHTTKTVEVLPDSCRTALSSSEDVRQDVVDFSALMERYPKLVIAAYKAGAATALGDSSATQTIVDQEKAINDRLHEINQHITPHVDAYLAARHDCLKH